MVERLFASPACRQWGFSRLNAQAGPGTRLGALKGARGDLHILQLVGLARDGGGRETDPRTRVYLIGRKPSPNRHEPEVWVAFRRSYTKSQALLDLHIGRGKRVHTSSAPQAPGEVSSVWASHSHGTPRRHCAVIICVRYTVLLWSALLSIPRSQVWTWRCARLSIRC